MKRFSLLLPLILLFFGVQARQVLTGFDFDEGNWALVGVPLHNYQDIPIQQELGAFILKNASELKQIQTNWNLETTFEDNCDYHYALKFYKDGNLVETVKLNLYCGYLTRDGLSYRFQEKHFETFKQKAKPINWSRITFGTVERMKQAISKLSKQPDVYFYDDPNPYKYPGFFTISVNNLPWDTNVDSVDQVVRKALEGEAGRTDFYLARQYYYVRGDIMFVRYLVNCDESFSSEVPDEKQVLTWRSHFQAADSVRLVAIGVSKKRYKRIMRDDK
ncbi:MAG: hypothetical protein AB8F95_05465 [Bacteroidia bacterium]